MIKNRFGQISLRLALVLFGIGVVILAGWTWQQTRPAEVAGRQAIVFWCEASVADDLAPVIHRFEQLHPQYKVVLSSSATRDLTGDAQRLLCAIVGGVPPDLVWFDRFAIGEWAGRSALTDLTPLLAAQKPDDPFRIDLTDYYPFAVAEASYAPPGSTDKPRLFGIPTEVDTRVLFINSDILRQAGLVDAQGNPRPPRDWDELRQYSLKLTTYRIPGDRSSGIVRLGFAPMTGNSWLYMWAFMAGGEFLSEDRTRVTLDSPPVVRALRYMVDFYDSLGGYAHVQAFNKRAQGGDQDPFLQGRLAMKIDGAPAMSVIADWKRDMDFMIANPPLPKDRVDAGANPVSWSGGWSLVIPQTAKQKEGAFRFMQFFMSWDGVSLLENSRREARQADGRLYLPKGNANRAFYDRLVRDHVEDNPDMPQTFKRAVRAVQALMPYSRIRPVTPIGQALWQQHVMATDFAVNHANAEEARRLGVDEVQLTLSRMGKVAQRRLDEIISPPPPAVVNWTPYFIGYVVLALCPVILIWLAYRHRRRVEGYRASEVRAGLLFFSPWYIGFALLVGGPILCSIVFSFTRYDVISPARYVGFENYRLLFRDPVFYTSLLNTAFMLISVPLSMIASLAIALLLNRSIRGIGFYRASFYVPAVVPVVAAAALWISLLDPSFGAINRLLFWLFDTSVFRGIESLISQWMDVPFRFTPPQWLNDASWSKPALILMKLWYAGGGMIIWLAGLQGIPPQLYEAAAIDGAGKWKQFRHVTLPMLSPYVLFNLIIGIIGTMQIFGEAYLLTAGGPANSTMFYAYYLFNQAFQSFRMGYASALAWILFLIVLGLTLVQLWLSKRWVHYEQS